MNYLNTIKVGSLFPSALLFSLFLCPNLFIFPPDPGKTLPESLDYNVFWLQTVAGEVDSKTGIPPPLLCLQIKDFLNGPGGCNAHVHTRRHKKKCNSIYLLYLSKSMEVSMETCVSKYYFFFCN